MSIRTCTPTRQSEVHQFLNDLELENQSQYESIWNVLDLYRPTQIKINTDIGVYVEFVTEKGYTFSFSVGPSGCVYSFAAITK